MGSIPVGATDKSHFRVAFFIHDIALLNVWPSRFSAFPFFNYFSRNNNIMNKNILTSLTIALVMVLTSCGKYEDGPFFSIRTKNSRLTGEWELSEYQSTTTYGDGTSYTYNFNGSIMTETYSSSFGGGTSSYAHSETWEFDKKENSVNINIISDGSASNQTTIWNWENGASEKELLNIDGTIYRIARLTNKEMVLEDINTSSSGYSSSTTYTFEKK
jgi:hypothetical protein